MNNIYDPFKATVESILEMCEKYGSFESISEDERVRANDFLNNIHVKCKDAFEYEKTFYDEGKIIDAEIVEVEDVSYSMNAHTHLEISTDENLEKNYKDGDKLKLIIVKEK